MGSSYVEVCVKIRSLKNFILGCLALSISFSVYGQNKMVEQDADKVLEEKAKNVSVGGSDLRSLLLLYTEGDPDASNEELANERRSSRSQLIFLIY